MCGALGGLWGVNVSERKATSEPAAEYVSVDALTPWDRNPRNNEAAVSEVAASIKRFGFASPIIARREDGMVIAGHTRLKAAKSLGMDIVPVRYVDLDPTEAQLLALADNKVGEIATWDDAALADILRDLDVGEATEGLGFDAQEIELLTQGAAAVGEDEWGDALGALPEGDRAPIQSMSFTMHDDQAETVKAALAASKALGDFGDTGNENSNGNALARICEMWMGAHG